MENNLAVEIAKLKNRLDKAVIFEVGPSLSIGVSTDDDLWRIRRDMDGDSCVFLNKSGIWENPPEYEDAIFAQRTGYDIVDEAFDAFDYYIKNYDYSDDIVFDIVGSQNELKN